MTYDAKNRILHTGVYTTENITPLEHKLLMALKDDNFVSYEELCKKIYGGYDEDYLINLRQIIFRLRKKTNNELIIENKTGLGFRIKNLYYEGEDMNKDITYCVDSIGCSYKYTCRRNLDNYKLKEGEEEQLWVCRFEHSNTKCEFFME